MLGNFIVNDTPYIPNTVANGVSMNDDSPNPINDWQPYSIYNPGLFNVNTTCPELVDIGGNPYCDGPGQANRFSLADAYNWEGGRGTRCDLWASLADKVPE